MTKKHLLSLKATFSERDSRHGRVVEFFSQVPQGMRAGLLKEFLNNYLELMEQGKVPRVEPENKSSAKDLEEIKKLLEILDEDFI